MTSAAALHPLIPLMRTVWLQVLRRKDVYLLALVMALFVAGAVTARFLGSGSAHMAPFVASLGYSLSSSLAALLAVIIGARQLPAEIESRTIYPVLAKPVDRDQVVWGKFLPTFGVSAALFILCSLVTFLVSPRLPFQDFAALAGAFLLQLLSLADLTMMLFALSLLVPSSVAVVAGLFSYFFGGLAINAAHQALLESAVSTRALGILPDFSLLDHFERYVNGGDPLAPFQFGAALLYGLLWFLFFSGLTLALFRRRPL